MAVGFRALYLVVLIASCWIDKCRQETTVQPCDNPVYCYGDLLNDVQTSNVFEDSKIFVDMPMKATPDMILAAFNNMTNVTQETLRVFVSQWFDPPGSDLELWDPPEWTERPAFLDTIDNRDYQQWASNLNMLWKSFGRKLNSSVMKNPSQHSLLSVNNPFIVPGGRFLEYYYWDTYWIIKGLLHCGMYNTTRGMIRNLASLINTYGFVPNGGRIYYTKRSQPPLLTWMVASYHNMTNDTAFVREVLPALDKEYQFWMTNRTVYIAQCNCNANHYASPVTSPRPESYREDVDTASDIQSEDQRGQLYSNIVSAAESGWDFSSRWLSPTGSFAGQLASMRTKRIVPVDLNAILGANEILLQSLHLINGSTAAANSYASAWSRRQTLLNNLFWSEGDGLYKDWSLDDGTHLTGFYASSLVPLYVFSLSEEGLNVTRSKLVLNQLRGLGVLDCPGGLPTSSNSSGQQWDYPNSWAPLQWFLVMGLGGADDDELKGAARELALIWLNSTHAAWLNYNHSMFEKYNCTQSGLPGGGGEYTIQSGFGWTNGVVLDFLSVYPSASPLSNSSSSSSPYLWFLSLIPTILVALVTTLCVLCCCHVYHKGKNRYWARIRNEQVIHSSNSSYSEQAQSPTIYSNKDAIESLYGYQDDTIYHLSDV